MPVGAMLATDRIAGPWSIVRNAPRVSGGGSVTGSLFNDGELVTTDQLLPGDHEYSGRVGCVHPAGDSYTTNYCTIHVVKGNPPGPSDVTPPVARLSGKTVQKPGKRLNVVVGCGERCTATATGRLKILSASGSFTLKSATKSIAAGAKATLKRAVPKRARMAAERALKQGKKVNATFKIAVLDAAGNRRAASRTITLKL